MAKHNPDQVAIVMDITGHCGSCHRSGNARLVAYYSGEVVIRCNHCKKAGQFEPDDKTFNDPKTFKPFMDSDDDANNQDSGRYTKGRR